MILFFDIETTGLPVSFAAPPEEIEKWPRAVQISWLIVNKGNEITKEENYVIKPNGYRIPADATQIHKTSHSYAESEGVEIKSVLDKLAKDLYKVSQAISFNVLLDKNVLISEFIRAKTKIDLKKLDFSSLNINSSYYFRNYNKKRLEFTLSNLYYLLFNDFYSNPNTSKADVKACYKCFKELGKRGIIDLSSYELQSIVSNNKYHANFITAITKAEELLNIKVKKNHQETLSKMLYINIITLMETYLSDAFINTVLTNEKLKIKFVETTPDFKESKLSISEIYKEMDKIEMTIKNQMLKVIYHNLGKVNRMYSDTLGITFPTDLKAIYTGVEVRHDLVHRNGKNKEGIAHELSKEIIQQLISDVKIFVNNVDDQLEALKSKGIKAKKERKKLKVS